MNKTNNTLLKTVCIITIMILISILIGLGVGILLRNSNSFTTENKKQNSSIKIRHAEKFNISTAEALNSTGKYKKIKIYEFDLEGEELNKINELLDKVSFRKIEGLKLSVLNDYEIIIDGTKKLQLSKGVEYAQYINKDDSYLIKISEELVNTVVEITNKRIENNI